MQPNFSEELVKQTVQERWNTASRRNLIKRAKASQHRFTRWRPGL